MLVSPLFRVPVSTSLTTTNIKTQNSILGGNPGADRPKGRPSTSLTRGRCEA